jgi:hypothetical protein
MEELNEATDPLDILALVPYPKPLKVSILLFKITTNSITGSGSMLPRRSKHVHDFAGRRRKLCYSLCFCSRIQTVPPDAANYAVNFASFHQPFGAGNSAAKQQVNIRNLELKNGKF